MKKYTYKDWWEGKIHLNTCNAIFPVGVKPLLSVALESFNDKDIIKIKNKQKKIFEKEKDFFLKRFLDGFTKRHKNSKLKDVFLNREYEQCKKMLTMPVPNEIHEKSYLFPHTDDYINGKDLNEYYNYFKKHIINGIERSYDFINSPNYPNQNESMQPREIFAQALIEYFEFLNTVKNNRANKLQLIKRKKESHELILNNGFEYCKSFEEFQQNLQIDEKTLDGTELLIKLRDYKINYSKADDHFSQFDKDGIHAKIYKKIINKINEDLNRLLTLGEPKRVSKRGVVSKEILVLKDIWEANKEGNKKEYDMVIELLLKENLEIGNPFITKINNNYKWNKVPFHNWVQYLAGFIYTCIKKKWILPNQSAPELKKILCRTFTIDGFDHKPFKSLKANQPDDKYLEPFKSIPMNE